MKLIEDALDARWPVVELTRTVSDGFAGGPIAHHYLGRDW